MTENLRRFTDYPGNVRVYHNDDASHSVAKNDIWLDGLYSNTDAAIAATLLSPKSLMELCKNRGDGNHYSYISFEEVQEAAKKELGRSDG